MGAVARSLKLHGGLPTGTATTLENAVSEIFNVKMVDADDVAGGGTTQTVGFAITDFAGAAVTSQIVLEFAVFDDVTLAVPAANATLDTATKGTIVSGAASAALKVQTDASGEFECTLTDIVDETVYLNGFGSFGSPMLDSREIDSVTFAA